MFRLPNILPTNKTSLVVGEEVKNKGSLIVNWDNWLGS